MKKKIKEYLKSNWKTITFFVVGLLTGLIL